jgi:alpha-L-fucosidase
MNGFSLAQGALGDFHTPEQEIPANGLPGQDWESCMTMNSHWGWNAADTRWKSSRELVRNLIDIASKGGNYLLNIGPRGDGSLTPETVSSFAAIAAWMRVNGEAIHGTTASPFPTLMPWGRATRKGRDLYLHIFDWPADGRLLVPVKNPAASATLLAAPGVPVPVVSTTEGLVLSLPSTAPDLIATVVRLSLDGPPVMY